MSAFEACLNVSAEDITFLIAGHALLPWNDFLLNPRRLRGSDFLMRWSQGVWSEKRLIQAVKETHRYFALPYGPSGVAPSHDVRSFELYFERLDQANLGKLKRPDLLLFTIEDEPQVRDVVQQLGGAQELPFISEDDPRMKVLLAKAFLAIECENSLWRAGQMPDYGAVLTPQRRLAGRLGLKKSAVVPTVIVKEEDRTPIRRWQRRSGIRVHIWHVFYDMAFGLPFDALERLVRSGKIEPTQQVFQAPGGPTTTKIIYKTYYHYAYPLGQSQEEPQLVATHVTDKNGHILPYVKFTGGRLTLTQEALHVLHGATGKQVSRTP